MEIGDGIELRPLDAEIADELFVAVDRNRARLGEWLAWVGWTRTVDDTRAWIGSTKEIVYTIWFQGRLAGCVGYDHDAINDQARIGYWLTGEAEGKGIMTRAVRAILRECFEEKGLNRAEICCSAGNRRSRAIPERLGFVEEGVRRRAEKLPQGYVDLVVYGQLATERHQIGQD